MSGALKAGSVYVAVSASIGEFTKTMQGVVKSVEQTAARVKAAMAPLADVGKIFAAGMGGAVLAASKTNAQIAGDLEKLKDYLVTFAAELGDAFGPMLRQITQTVGSVVGAFQRLSPETKGALAHVIAFMAALGAGAAVVGKAATLVEGVAKATGTVLVPALEGASKAAALFGEIGGATLEKWFSGLAKSVAEMEGGVLKSVARMVLGFGAVLLPIAAVAAAVAGVALLAGSLYEAWSDSSTGMKDSILSAWDSIKGLGAKLADTFAGWWQSLKGFILDTLKLVLDAAAGMVRKLAGVLAPLARGLGLDGLASVYEDLQQLTGDKLLKDLQAGASFLADKATSAARTLADGAVRVGKDVAEGVSYGIGQSVKGLKRIAKDTGLDALPGKLKAALSGVLGGPAANIRETPEVDVSTVGKGPGLGASTREFASGMSFTVKVAQDRFAAAARKMWEDAAATMKAAREQIASKFASAFGDLSSLISTFQEGLTAGGPAGGFVAVMGELLTRSEQFQRFVEVLNGIVAMVADTVGRLVEPFIPLLGAVSMLVRAGLDALAPAFSMLSSFIQPLVPPLVVVGQLLEALAPVIAIAVAAMALIQQPLQLFAGPAMHALFDVLKFVSKTILTVVKAVAGVWNSIVGAIQSVLRTLADLSIFGAKPLGFLKDWANGLNGAMISTDALGTALQNLSGLTWDQAQAAAAQTAEQVRNYRNLQKANEELSNVPNAYKLALSRFSAQSGQVGFTPAPGSTVPVPTTGGNAANNNGRGPRPGQETNPVQGPAVVVGDVTINASNPTEAVSQLDQMLDKLSWKATGSRGRAGRYSVPEAS